MDTKLKTYSSQHWNEIFVKTFDQSWQGYIICINVMFIKLIKFNKLILNMKFINVLTIF
jgi:hypothetical protein